MDLPKTLRLTTSPVQGSDLLAPMMTSMNGIATTGIHHHTAIVYATNVFYDDLRDNKDDVRKQSNTSRYTIS